MTVRNLNQLIALEADHMPDWTLKTPVAFLIFNRPDTTQLVFNAIAKARTPKLFVIADGARAHKPGEDELCAQTRAIIDQVDWQCEVVTNFSETNLGCRYRVSSGLDWVFEQVPEAIILEDDCLPDPSFFRFCEEMLERYRDDDRISMISGDNFQSGITRGNASYYYSIYSHIWGWATWRRAWKDFDVTMAAWPGLKTENWLDNKFKRKKDARYWKKIFQLVHEEKLDSWAYGWTFTNFLENRLSVMPNCNLISNIGFDTRATHTSNWSPFAAMKTSTLPFPLCHPKKMVSNDEADKLTAKVMFSSSYSQKIRNIMMAHWNEKVST